MISTEQHCKVWIETPDGKLMAIDAIAVSMSYQSDWNGLIQSRIELAVLGAPTWMSTETLLERIELEKQAAEWMCDYCGRPNKKERETCVSCGSVRPFIYRD